jgi:ubiquinone/menaquinone biosynthesis C-methylase UbiE
MSQRQVFSEGEGDAWFRRNRAAVTGNVLPAEDPVLRAFSEMGDASPRSVLEIGCGAGQRGAAIAAENGASVSGIDPSAEAVAHACGLGLDAHVGTADSLPFKDGQFDAVLFGFCLYLCDRDDLFRIAAEADRVLARSGWVVIHDFFTTEPQRRPYRHVPGLWSFKMDYRRLFDWHPNYVCKSHRVIHHVSGEHTDELQEWVAVSVPRKFSADD